MTLPGSINLVIMIPTYNEAGSIEKLIKKLGPVLSKVRTNSCKILIVDDNSPDGTGKVVLKIAKRNKKVFLLSRLQKTGLGAAYFDGMKHAFDVLGADIVIVMDADLSHNPIYIPGFLKKIEEGADMVIGSRYIKGGTIAKKWALHRKFLSVFGNLVTRFLLGSNTLHDWTSGYRAIKKDVFGKVAPYLTDFRGYTFNISFAYFAIGAGFVVSELPIKFIDRTDGESKLGFEYIFHTPIFLIKSRLKKLLSV